MRRPYFGHYANALGRAPYSFSLVARGRPRQTEDRRLHNPSFTIGWFRSFNEMVIKGDKDILSYLDTNNYVYTCFRPAEDVFIILSYHEPFDFQYKKDAEGLSASGFIKYVRFSEGLVEDFRVSRGTWFKIAADDTDIAFSAKDATGKTNVVFIDQSQISFDYTYTNTQRNKVMYSYQIRRSTLRFLESFTWEEPAIPKTAKTPAQPASQGTSSNSGYCAEFKPTK